MKLKFKNNFLGYFQFFYSVIGNKLLVNLGLSVVVSALDGMGLALFMPLLQSVSEGGGTKKSMGYLHFLTDAITGLGFGLTINTVLATMVILFIVKGLLKFYQLNSQVQLYHLFMRKVRFSLLDNLQNLEYSGFFQYDAGKFQNTLTAEVMKLNNAVKTYFNAVQSSVMLATYIVLAFLANFQFALFVAAGAGLSNLLYRRIYKSTKKASFGISKKGAVFNGLLTQAIHHFKYLRSTNTFGKFSVHLRVVIKETEELYRKMGFFTAVTTSIKEPMILIIVASVIAIQVNFMGAAMAGLIVPLLLFYRALGFLVIIQNFWQTFINNIGAMQSVASLNNGMAELQERKETNQFPSFKSDIHFKNVNFSYGSNHVLKNLDIVIEKNQTIALVGESGSGKSTIANLVAGLIQPTNGVILIDAVPLNSYDLNSYRNNIGYISQEAVIFNDTVFNNVTFWAERNEENLRRFEEALQLASLTDFVSNLALKENTILGDNGMLISGGQKQRISIARELFKNVQILILDEATSALDSETEKVIQENLDNLHGKFTMIIIAHRLFTVRNADQIYLLDKGEVRASGSFNQLVLESDKFKQLVQLQGLA